jgi:uncharacterized membrane protein YhaH (DUF805 family)
MFYLFGLSIQISAFVFGFTALFFLARFISYIAIYNRRMDARAKLIMSAMAAVIAIASRHKHFFYSIDRFNVNILLFLILNSSDALSKRRMVGK